MKSLIYKRMTLLSLLIFPGWSQPPGQPIIRGHFLTDSIVIGRPFQYSLAYRHPSHTDILFPDTAMYFRPYRVQKVDLFSTQTTGIGVEAISLDSAVYTLVSFETDSTQLLRVPIRSLNNTDCTAHWTQTDTVFLQSKLAPAQPGLTQPPSLTLAAETELAPLSQQFNYEALLTGLLVLGTGAALVYGLFGRAIQRQWQLRRLDRQHKRFLRNYNQLNQRIDSFTAAETANEAVVMWKMYLEQLERQTYSALTTPELAERINDNRVTDALREADRMIYGGTFSTQSQVALLVLRDVATQTYRRSRTRLQRSSKSMTRSAQRSDSAETSSFS